MLLYSPTALSAALDGGSERVAEAARALLPGTVTCLVNDPERRFVAAAGDTPGSVGLRVPEVGEVLASVELPLVATSANRPRGSEPARMRDVPSDLRAAAATLDAGPLPGVASSVVDLRPVESGEPARLIRPGPNSDAVRAALGALAIELVGAD